LPKNSDKKEEQIQCQLLPSFFAQNRHRTTDFRTLSRQFQDRIFQLSWNCPVRTVSGQKHAEICELPDT